ncbi:response regulator [Paraburkholderia sp. J76]|uniref:response regulator n=1 Tax=Paraburkholderia sp. J76 TaxID=2805439 RepID=UPI002ABE8961|nr:response regulator [Paraburkholderia sp. J76]
MNGNAHLIVILEDDASLRRALDRLLRHSGFNTRSFRSAEDADASGWASSAHCLILDVHLPGASGPEFYGTLVIPRPPAVFTTAYDGSATRRAVRSIGDYPLLTKPFTGEALLDAVRQALSKNG